MFPIFLQSVYFFLSFFVQEYPDHPILSATHIFVISIHQIYDAVDFELHVQEPYFTLLKGDSQSLS